MLGKVKVVAPTCVPGVIEILAIYIHDESIQLVREKEPVKSKNTNSKERADYEMIMGELLSSN